MARLFLIAVGAIALGAGALFWWQGSGPSTGGALASPRPHHALDQAQSLERVHVTAVYVVPANREPRPTSDWAPMLESALKELQAFHSVQFRGSSSLTYTIVSEPVIGREANNVYDTNDTNYGNPQALRQIRAELEERMSTGDLVSLSSTGNEGAYRSFILLYEGVGAAGGGDTVLLSQLFFERPEYAAYRSSLLAHEYYHTLGLDDEYTFPHDAPQTRALMGAGRYQPLAVTSLSPADLRAFGL